jgi:hypothetical protein
LRETECETVGLINVQKGKKGKVSVNNFCFGRISKPSDTSKALSTFLPATSHAAFRQPYLQMGVAADNIFKQEIKQTTYQHKTWLLARDKNGCSRSYGSCRLGDLEMGWRLVSHFK